MSRKGGLGKGLDSLIPFGSLEDLGRSLDTEKKTNKDENPAENPESEKSETVNTTVKRRKSAASAEKSETEKSKTAKSKAEVKISNEPLEVKISQVEPNKDQPRKNFDEDALEELAESIRQHGIIQPIVVVKNDEHYEIVTGERRFRAAKLAGLSTVPVLVKEFTEQEIMEISLIENIQREDLNPIEEALAYQRLAKEFHMKQDEIAKRVGKNRSVISNTVRLLKLDEEVQKMVASGAISGGHARALLGLENKDEQYDLATRIVEEELSVRDVEEMVKSMNMPAGEEESPEQQPLSAEEEQAKLYYEKYENILRNLMGTKVSIKKKKHDRGKIEIEYYSMDELERLLSLLQSCE